MSALMKPKLRTNETHRACALAQALARGLWAQEGLCDALLLDSTNHGSTTTVSEVALEVASRHSLTGFGDGRLFMLEAGLCSTVISISTGSL